MRFGEPWSTGKPTKSQCCSNSGVRRAGRGSPLSPSRQCLELPVAEASQRHPCPGGGGEHGGGGAPPALGLRAGEAAPSGYFICKDICLLMLPVLQTLFPVFEG